MPGHGIWLEQLHALDHVHAVGLQRCIGTLPGVAAVKEQHLVVAAIGADRLDQRRRAVEPAELAVCPRQVDIIDHGVGIGIGAALLDIEVIEEFLRNQVRRNAGIGANPDVGVRRTEVDRLELGMAVGEMQQRHLALGIELQQIILRQLLLRQRARRICAQPCRAEHKAGIQGILQKISPGMHPILHLGEKRTNDFAPAIAEIRIFFLFQSVNARFFKSFRSEER